MQFLLFALFTLFAGTFATPITTETSGPICNAMNNPQCCSVTAMGILSLTCNSPSRTMKDAEELKDHCHESGKEPFCCVLPVAGAAIICTSAL